MANDNKPSQSGAKAFYEVLGTMILVSTICFVVTTPLKASVIPPLSIIPLGLYVAIQIGGKVSGGHFNPAVSLAIHVADNKSFPMSSLALYWMAQFVGGILGYFLAYPFIKSRPLFLMGGGVSLAP